jgi:hypothetical protein
LQFEQELIKSCPPESLLALLGKVLLLHKKRYVRTKSISFLFRTDFGDGSLVI